MICDHYSHSSVSPVFCLVLLSFLTVEDEPNHSGDERACKSLVSVQRAPEQAEAGAHSFSYRKPVQREKFQALDLRLLYTGLVK